MKSNIALLKLRATKDDYQILGEVLITEGKEYDAVQANGLVLISDDITFIRTIDYDNNIDGFEIISREEINSIGEITIDSISSLLKTKQIERWVDENIDPNSVKLVRFTENCRLLNNGAYMAGVEYFKKGEVFVGLVSTSGELMIQKRKGVIFYLDNNVNNPIVVKDLDDTTGHSYNILKELKFMYENDHKRS